MRLKYMKFLSFLRKHHAIPVLALSLAAITAGERAHHREESVIGEAFILAEVEHVVRALGGAE